MSSKSNLVNALESAFNIVKNNASIFFLNTLIYAGIVLLSARLPAAFNVTNGLMSLDLKVVVVLLTIFSFVASTVAFAGFSSFALKISSEGKVSNIQTGSFLREGLSKFFQVSGIVFITILPYILACSPVFIPFFWHDVGFYMDPNISAIMTIIFFPIAFYFSSFFTFALAFLFDEKLDVIASLKASKVLVGKNYRGVLLFLFILIISSLLTSQMHVLSSFLGAFQILFTMKYYLTLKNKSED
jgi:hypothetical protein